MVPPCTSNKSLPETAPRLCRATAAEMPWPVTMVSIDGYKCMEATYFMHVLYVYVYIYIHVYIYIYMYVCISVYNCIDVYGMMYMNVHPRSHVWRSNHPCFIGNIAPKPQQGHMSCKGLLQAHLKWQVLEDFGAPAITSVVVNHGSNSS